MVYKKFWNLVKWGNSWKQYKNRYKKRVDGNLSRNTDATTYKEINKTYGRRCKQSLYCNQFPAKDTDWCHSRIFVNKKTAAVLNF